jgi:outer membrane protein OmpA-like peptidoglycan-associated protein
MSIPRYALVLVMLLTVAGTASAAKATKPAPEAAQQVAAQAVPCCIPSGDYDEDGVQDRLDQCDNTPKGCLVNQYGCSLDADGDGVCDGVDQCPDTPKGEKVNKVGCSKSQLAPPPAKAPEAVTPPPAPEPPAPAPAPTPAPSKVEQQLVETGSIVLNDVYFDLNKATLKPESEAPLNEAGAALEKFPALKIEVQGHTDSRGSAIYNKKLSQGRAETVRDYLLSHYHLAAENVIAKGYGESQLAVSPEKSADDFAANRRVVLRAVNAEVLPKNVKLEQQTK